MAALVLVLAMLYAIGEASAQTRPPWSPATARVAIASDLQQAVTLAQQVIGMIANTTDPEELKRADALNTRAYLRLNNSVLGIQHLQVRSTVPEPLLTHAVAIINKARETMAGAHTRILGAAAYEQGRTENIALAIQMLDEAIVLVRRAAELVSI